MYMRRVSNASSRRGVDRAAAFLFPLFLSLSSVYVYAEVAAVFAKLLCAWQAYKCARRGKNRDTRVNDARLMMISREAWRCSRKLRLF